MLYNQERSAKAGVRILWRNSRTEVNSHPYLGVGLDNKMRWSPPIEVISSRTNDVLGLIKRKLWNCPKSVKESAYTTLVRPKLQYACGAWDPHYQKDKSALERYHAKRHA